MTSAELLPAQGILPATTDVLIIGAGPAGLAAAEAAGSAGAAVVVVDEYARPGGQYYRESRLAGRLPEGIIGSSQRQGREQLERLSARHVRLFCDTLVWCTFGGTTVQYVRNGVAGQIEAKAIVLATGAHERVVPFPGWDLPGVMTAGSAQSMLKEQAILPGSRIAISGCGPFLYPVATQLLAAGANVPAILEAHHDPIWALRSPSLYPQIDKYIEALGYLVRLKRHRGAVRFGMSVVEVRGDGRAEEAVIAKLDRDWREIPGTRETVSVDCVLLNNGFVPNTQVPRLFGCELEWNSILSSFSVRRDADQRSSQDLVFVAGEVTGFGGHKVAKAEGFIAGVSAAHAAGSIDAATASRLAAQSRRVLARDQAFANHVNRTFAVRPGLFDRIRDDTIVCRCEEVPASAVRKQARLWEGALRPIKQCTRAGMGQCQGRMCHPTIAAIAAHESGRAISELGVDSIRPSVKPVELRDIADLKT